MTMRVLVLHAAAKKEASAVAGVGVSRPDMTRSRPAICSHQSAFGGVRISPQPRPVSDFPKFPLTAW
jgi:hypothetical protein